MSIYGQQWSDSNLAPKVGLCPNLIVMESGAYTGEPRGLSTPPVLSLSTDCRLRVPRRG